MWTRKELKTRAKAGLKQNYWKSVLVAFLYGAIVVGSGSVSTSGASDGNSTGISAILSTVSSGDMAAVLSLMFGMVLLSGLVAVAIQAFCANPVAVGAAKFSCSANDGTAPMSDISAGFKFNYLANVKTVFLKNLFICLWSLLLVIPGIIKAYEYAMVEYLIADDPNLTTKEALAKSKAMMQGNKWNLFVLQLSFIGWDILSALTFGLLQLFYVAPYRMLTTAALYQKLKENA